MKQKLSWYQVEVEEDKVEEVEEEEEEEEEITDSNNDFIY